MPTRTEAIKNFLSKRTVKDLADFYYDGMEVQVNVHQADGERNNRVFEGKSWVEWSNGVDSWKSFRIPYNADSEPEYEDKEMFFSLERYADAIGMTGWDWKQRLSRWVAFDFDAISSHKEGISPEEMHQVQEEACKIPWVTVRYSTSGTGLHLYVELEPVRTNNHTEHAAVGRAIIAKMSALTGFDFDNKVDICGGNMWVWARKMVGTNGLQLIKQGTRCEEPPDWKQHMDVCKRKTRTRVEKNQSLAECMSNAPGVPLDYKHKELIKWLEEKGEFNHWWDQDHGVMVTHTLDLKKAHEELLLDGIFMTSSSGSSDHNCFMYPLMDGAWSVRRFTRGVSEHESWVQDGSGWTHIFFNRLPTFEVACNTYHGAETDKDSFVFSKLPDAQKVLNVLGANYEIPDHLKGRDIDMKPKGNKVVLTVEYTENLEGWARKTAKKIQKVLNVNMSRQDNHQDNYDHLIRHLITEAKTDAGWVVNSEGWVTEKESNVARVLTTVGLKTTEAQQVMGSSVLKPFSLVCKPFEPEYLGGRRWNRYAPQFNFEPDRSQDLSHPHWDSIFNHVGKSLTPFVLRNVWCQENTVRSGGEYLKCWLASLIQYPMLPLPYLFIYGITQNTGKSTFHEAIDLLFSPGVKRAEHALSNNSGFNGELENAILCVIEEVNLNPKTLAKIKDWVTGKYLNIRKMYQQPYQVRNMTHWIQVANPIDACPIFPGDTRITMVNVRETPENEIPREDLHRILTKEAPAFLGSLLRLELPEHKGRLRIPVISTDDKVMAADAHGSQVEQFIKKEFRFEQGSIFPYDEFIRKFNRFNVEADPWPDDKIKSAMNLERHPIGVLKGEFDNVTYIGNLAFKKSDYNIRSFRYISVGGELIKEKL